jgi:hypothetical protein
MVSPQMLSLVRQRVSFDILPLVSRMPPVPLPLHTFPLHPPTELKHMTHLELGVETGSLVRALGDLVGLGLLSGRANHLSCGNLGQMRVRRGPMMGGDGCQDVYGGDGGRGNSDQLWLCGVCMTAVGLTLVEG